MPRLSLLQPQEIEVFFILPALRRDLAKVMKKRGFEQKKIAKLLGITEPAVSQYLNNKRATKVVFSPELKKEIEASAGKIKDEESLIQEIQRLLVVAREEMVTCGVHEDLVPSLKGCTACAKAEKSPIIISKANKE
jgi:predicted transcriptional regulator